MIVLDYPLQSMPLHNTSCSNDYNLVGQPDRPARQRMQESENKKGTNSLFGICWNVWKYNMYKGLQPNHQESSKDSVKIYNLLELNILVLLYSPPTMVIYIQLVVFKL